MNLRYKLTYRRRRSLWPFWRTHTVVGHRLDPACGKIVLYYEDGSVRELANPEQIELKLGTDWLRAHKKAMESQAGQAIPLAVADHN